MTTIYRIELGDGTGMYSADRWSAAYEISRQMISVTNHPEPQDDAKIGDQWVKLEKTYAHHQYRFGFGSIEQLKEWIYLTDWREGLDKYGFRVYVYTAEKAYVGDRQAFFLKETATREYSISLMEI